MAKKTQNTNSDGTNGTLLDKKEKFLRILEQKNFNVTSACKATNIGRRTYYNWLEDEEFNQSIEDLKETEIDTVESELHKLIKSGNPVAIIFYLKTKGKSRGYIEKQELEYTKHISEVKYNEM